jgi:DNA-binding LacI/PurR family transcriptional regulator
MNKEVNDIRELAKILGLSITTVSRVLNGKATRYRISSETIEAVSPIICD